MIKKFGLNKFKLKTIVALFLLPIMNNNIVKSAKMTERQVSVKQKNLIKRKYSKWQNFIKGLFRKGGRDISKSTVNIVAFNVLISDVS